jgi:hypothetical protein
MEGLASIPTVHCHKTNRKLWKSQFGRAQQQDKFLLYFTGPSGCVWAYQQLGITEETNFTKKPSKKDRLASRPYMYNN